MISQQLLHEIDEKEPTYARSALQIFFPDKEQEPWIDLVCRAYLGSDDADRSRLISHLADKEGILNCLLGNAYRCAEMLKQTKDAEWLRLGLASAYLASRKMDYRDVLLAQAELYVVAEEAGITPDLEFQQICQIDDFGSYAVVASRRSGTHPIED